MHLGVILPNYGEDAAPGPIRELAEAAEELGFDSVWATEHIIVGPEAVDPYGRVYAPLVTLGWIAGFTRSVGLGTSIVLVPLHHPIHLAKEVATLHELSEGRVLLGVGMGWHEDEFRFLGYEFRGRGRRADEALRLMRALWRGERTFHGEHWSFEDATFQPLPQREPEVWVGGASERAIRRARELGDVWHPSRGVGPDDVRRVKERHPELRIVPRTTPDQVDAFLEAGAEGAVVSVPDVESLRELAARYRSRTGLTVFSPEERARVRERVLEVARADPRVSGGAITGSVAVGAEDRWSDVDTSFGVADSVDPEAVLAEWTELLAPELGVLHHWDLRSGATIYRVYLLRGGLELNIAVTPAAEFGARGPRFQLVFGEGAELPPVDPPRVDELVGYGWLYAINTRTAIERAKLWQAEYFISCLRNHALALACVRLGQPAVYGRGFDLLPSDVTGPYEEALVRSLEPDELRRALAVATSEFLREVERADPVLAGRLEEPLGELTAP